MYLTSLLNGAVAASGCFPPPKEFFDRDFKIEPVPIESCSIASRGLGYRAQQVPRRRDVDADIVDNASRKGWRRSAGCPMLETLWPHVAATSIVGMDTLPTTAGARNCATQMKTVDDRCAPSLGSRDMRHKRIVRRSVRAGQPKRAVGNIHRYMHKFATWWDEDYEQIQGK